jgi:hypothetical protein
MEFEAILRGESARSIPLSPRTLLFRGRLAFQTSGLSSVAGIAHFQMPRSA